MFADKTGTLTENVMEFKRCTVDGKMYRYVWMIKTVSHLKLVKLSMCTFSESTNSIQCLSHHSIQCFGHHSIQCLTHL